MRRIWTEIFTFAAVLLLLAATLFLGYISWEKSVVQGVALCIGVMCSFFFAPILHELGHVVFARANGMRCVLVKCAIFRYTNEGKGKLRLASPFTPDQTQVLPKSGGDMKKRAKAYTLGGLIVQGSALIGLCALAIVLSCMYKTSYFLWGVVPYTAYLFLINAVPLEYPNGKTDMLVYVGLCKGKDAEKNMLSAMQIQGELYAGKSFAEIAEKWFFDVPQLAEDEPLFAVMQDLRYRFYLEKGDMEKASDAINRLAQASPYLSEREMQKLAAELTYMHVVNGDFERANECAKLCEEYLRTETVTAKRVLAAYSASAGKTEETEALLAQAQTLLQRSFILGQDKFEKILLERIGK